MTGTQAPVRDAETVETGAKRKWLLWVVGVAGAAAIFGLVLVLATSWGDEEFTHAYEFNGTLDDEYGGAPVIALGGVVEAEGYVFGPNEGVVVDLDLGDTYTLETRFRIDETNPGAWAKILDFKSRSADGDGGLYLFQESTLQFYFSESCGGTVDVPQGCTTVLDEGARRSPLHGPRGAMSTGTFVTVRLVRDGDAGTVEAYVDAELQSWSILSSGEPFGDSEPLMAFDDFFGEAIPRDGTLHVMVDDQASGTRESASGEIDYIRIKKD